MKAIKITQRILNRDSLSFKQYLSEISKFKTFTSDEETECSIKAYNGDQKAIDELIKRNLKFVVTVAKQYDTPSSILEDLVNEGNIGLIMAVKEFKPDKGFKFITYAVYWIRKKIVEYLANVNKMIRVPINKQVSMSKVTTASNTLEQSLGRSADISELSALLSDVLTEDEIRETIKFSKIGFDSFDAPVEEVSDGIFNKYDVFKNEDSETPDKGIMDEDLRLRINYALRRLKPRDRSIIECLFGLNGRVEMSINDVSEMVGLSKEMVRQIKIKSLKTLESSFK